MSEKTIDEAEARRILEHLARNGPPTAQVASIKVLREMDKDARAAEAEAKEKAGLTGFDQLDELYDIEFSRRPGSG
jgi:hypothetical protein